VGNLIFFVVVAAAIGVVAYAAHRYEQRKRAAAVALARSRGYEIAVEDKAPPPLSFDLFGIGSSRKISYQIWKPGSHDSAFQYRYTTGSGKNKQTHRRSCVLVEVPFTCPHLTIGPEGFWSAIGRAVGLRDIEIESPQFNDRYRVRCADERFAVTLLDQRMIAWMLSPNSGGGAVKFEFGGRWMLCFGDDVPFEQLFGFLDWVQHARTNLPAVLTSLYPPV
jgi:hypothetical protein